MTISHGPSVRVAGTRGLFALMLITAMLPSATAASAPRADEPPGLSDAAPKPNKTPEALARTDRVLVRWSTRLSAKAAGASPRLAALASASGRGAAFVRFTGSGAAVYDLGAPLGDKAGGILLALGKLDGVATVEPDLWMTADALPNDPRAAELWGLLGAADGHPYGIDARGAWATTTGTGVVVAVIDTGLVAHEDLTGQAVAGYDMIWDLSVSNDGDGRDADASDPGDSCGTRPSQWHGTHVAGTIAALSNNAIGVFGGAPGVKIQPVRVLGTCGGYMSDVADGIRWAAGGTVPGVPANATPARVLNLSLGSTSPLSCLSEMTAAISDARGRAAVVVVAAGNDTADASLFSPANCNGVITVAATHQAGQRASFSNFGSAVEIAAPGVAILSTVDSGAAAPAGSTYVSHQGTSMASPHVALSAALVIAAHSGLAPDAVEVVLAGTATSLALDGSSTGCPALGCGSGIVNAGRAIARLGATTPIVGRVVPSERTTEPNAPITVNAGAVDLSGIASAQLNVDGGPWASMSAADGAFGGTFEPLSTSIAAPATGGTHTICVRAIDLGANTSDGTACTTVIVIAGASGDDFVDATAITGTSGSIDGTNAGATREAGEPPTSTIDRFNGPNSTVWYRWTAPISGVASIDLCASRDYDTLMAVYLGSSMDSLIRVADDDDTFGCGNSLQSMVSFAAASGTTYQIQVDGFSGATGIFRLTWSLIETIPPAVSSFAPTTSSPTSSPAIAYTLTFSEPVTGLATSDFSATGTSFGWTIGSVTGSGAGPYTVNLIASAPTSGTVALALRANGVIDLAGNTGPTTDVPAATVLVDAVAPVASAPKASLATGTALDRTTVPVRLAWSGSDAGSGLARFELELSTNGGAFVPLALPIPTATTLSPSLSAGSASYRFRVRAIDAAGNASAWAAGPILHVRKVQESSTAIRYAGTWSRGSATAALGGRYRVTTRARASATYVFTGRSVAWVASGSSAFGSARVFIDGVSRGTVNLRASPAFWRRIVFSRTWATPGRHTIRIVGLGTAGHPRVSLDAFVVVQ